MTQTEPASSPENALIDRLMSHDICYFDGGSREPGQLAAPLVPLLRDLAQTSNSRLRSALIALLLRHPEQAPTAETVARGLPPGDPTARLLLLSTLVAAALQSEWSFSLDLYLPHKTRIEADHLAVEFGLPLPREDYGRACMEEAARLLRKDGVFPVNHEADWENAVHRLLAQLVREARARGS